MTPYRLSARSTFRLPDAIPPALYQAQARTSPRWLVLTISCLIIIVTQLRLIEVLKHALTPVVTQQRKTVAAVAPPPVAARPFT